MKHLTPGTTATIRSDLSTNNASVINDMLRYAGRKVTIRSQDGDFFTLENIPFSWHRSCFTGYGTEERSPKDLELFETALYNDIIYTKVPTGYLVEKYNTIIFVPSPHPQELQ
jgi:hypothetical protein